MDSSSNKPETKQPDGSNPTAYGAWGALAGAAIGLIVGLCTRHWLAWALLIGSIGMVIGGLVDRSRR